MGCAHFSPPTGLCNVIGNCCANRAHPPVQFSRDCNINICKRLRYAQKCTDCTELDWAMIFHHNRNCVATPHPPPNVAQSKLAARNPEKPPPPAAENRESHL